MRRKSPHHPHPSRTQRVPGRRLGGEEGWLASSELAVAEQAQAPRRWLQKNRCSLKTDTGIAQRVLCQPHVCFLLRGWGEWGRAHDPRRTWGWALDGTWHCPLLACVLPEDDPMTRQRAGHRYNRPLECGWGLWMEESALRPEASGPGTTHLASAFHAPPHVTLGLALSGVTG